MTKIYYNNTPTFSPCTDHPEERWAHYAENDVATSAAEFLACNSDDPVAIRAVLLLVEGREMTVEIGGVHKPGATVSINPSPPAARYPDNCSRGVSAELKTVADLVDPNIFERNVQNEGKAGHMLRVDRGRTGRVAFVTDWDGCYKVGLYDSWDHYQAAGVVEGVEVPHGADFEFSQAGHAQTLISAWLLHDDDVVGEILSPPRFVYEIEAVMTCNVTVRIEGPLTEEEARDAVEEHLSGYGSGSSAEFETQYIDDDAGIEAEVIDVEVWQGVQDLDTISAEEV